MKAKYTRRLPHEPATHLVADAMAKTTSRYPDVYTVIQPGHCTAMVAEEEGHRFVFHTTTQVKLCVTLYSDEVIRFRYVVDDFRPDFSYALAEDAHFVPPTVHRHEDDTHYYLHTTSLKCSIQKADLRIQLHEHTSGRLILADAESFYARSSINEGLNHLRLSLRTQPDEAFLGLGDKSCALNLRGRYLQHWNTDAFGFGPDTDPLYRSVPFYYSLCEGQAYGFFLHNTWRSHFDFNANRDDVTRIWAEGGEMDFFILNGPNLNEVARRYHNLTGKPELPPRWALGFHQCRWSYHNENRVRELAAEFRTRQIPCDAIYLDIDYMDGYRCFTWDKRHFPNPAKLLADLREQGFRTVSMIDPGIRVDDSYDVYQQGVARDAFCRRTSGELMVGPVWPSRCVWPDYTRADVRAWWGELYRELYLRDGVSGFWNDMNEPAVFKVDSMTFPDEVRHDLDGQPGNHREAHNIYGMQMARASYEGLKAIDPSRRPFLLTRATFSGGQRYAALWTGDNVASWEHLRLANIQCQRASISGFSFVGTDIGGFVDQPTGELFSRWIQLGVFHPLFRVHSMGNNVDGASEADALAIMNAEGDARMDQEPWSFGEPYTSYVRTAIELRYRLLPYLYTSFYRQATDGTPILRSLIFEDQHDPNALRKENEFMFGPHLLVSPVLQRGIKTQRVYLPAGEWREYYSGRIHKGGGYVRATLKPDRLPLYVRAGAIIPNFPVMQYTDEFEPDTAELRIYHGVDAFSECYFDAGDGQSHKQGECRLHRFEAVSTDTSIRIRQTIYGQHHVGPAVFRMLFFALPFDFQEILIDGMPIQEVEEADGGIAFLAPMDFEEVVVR